jgi:hypothetical protein
VPDGLGRADTPGDRPAPTYVCSYPVSQHAELSVFVEGGASAGYSISGIEFGD